MLTDPSRGAIFSATGRVLGHLPGRQVQASAPPAPRRGRTRGRAGGLCGDMLDASVTTRPFPPAPQLFSQGRALEICCFSLVCPLFSPHSPICCPKLHAAQNHLSALYRLLSKCNHTEDRGTEIWGRRGGGVILNPKPPSGLMNAHGIIHTLVKSV